MAQRLTIERKARSAVGEVALALLLADRKAKVGARIEAVNALAALRREQRHDMVADRTETRDLAAAEPAKLKELIVKWETWATRAHVIPWPHTPQYGETPTAASAKKGKKKP